MASGPGITVRSGLQHCPAEILTFERAGEFAEEDLAGFTEAASGLKYKDVVVGDGAMPTPGNAVQTHYSGSLHGSASALGHFH